MTSEKGKHPLYIRYIQSPFKSRADVNKSMINEFLKRIQVDQINYSRIVKIIDNSQYLRDQTLQIKRYLRNDSYKFALKIIRVYAKSYHVNYDSLIQDNCLFQLQNVDWLKLIHTVVHQLQIVYKYPNFKSLKRSRYRDYLTFDFGSTGPVGSDTRQHLLNKKIPLHIKIRLLHIPLAKHARLKLAPLRKGHRHYMYNFSAIRCKWHGNSRNHPFGRYGSVMIRHIVYQGREVASHMWLYGKKNLQNITPMSRGTHFSFQGWVAKYLKHHNRCYDYRINHIRNVKVIKDRNG